MPDISRVSVEVANWLTTLHLSGRAEYAGYLVVEEMLTNIVKYSYDDADEHTVYLHVALDEEYLRITLKDDGHYFDPTQIPVPDVEELLESRKVGGLGIELVRRMCERIEYNRADGWNICVFFIRRLSPADTQPLNRAAFSIPEKTL